METLYEYFQRMGLLDYEATPSVIAEAKDNIVKPTKKNTRRNSGKQHP